MKASFLNSTLKASPLQQAQALQDGTRRVEKKHRDLAPILPLTSLIDAFSIIVIYLLIGTQSGGVEMGVPTRIDLPIAQTGIAADDSAIVRIEKGMYFINDKQVSLKGLGAALYELKTKMKEGETQIVVQADQKMDYADLDPLIKASSEAGIQKLKFAVMPK